jgi:ribosome-associated translation inhibitor RaiA
MRLEIRTHGMRLDEADLSHLEQSMHQALHRFEGRIERAMVYLSDENGPKGGGNDRKLKCVLSMPPDGRLTVEVRDHNLPAAIDRMADRVGFAVGREVDRRRDHRGAPSASGLMT